MQHHAAVSRMWLTVTRINNLDIDKKRPKPMPYKASTSLQHAFAKTKTHLCELVQNLCEIEVEGRRNVAAYRIRTYRARKSSDKN